MSSVIRSAYELTRTAAEHILHSQGEADTVIDLGGNILSPGLIDIQINGAYNFDFSVYEGDDEAYLAGLDMVARRIVETGVTSLLPTIITQSANLYPALLRLLKPFTPLPDSHTGSAGGATMLGWHAEGPFLQPLKRGAHTNSLLRSAPDGWDDVQNVYGDANLIVNEDWQMQRARAACAWSPSRPKLRV